MTRKAVNRIYPYHDKKQIKMGFAFLSIITLFFLIALVSNIIGRNGILFVFFLLFYGVFFKIFGIDIINDIKAYNKQHLFQESSLTTNATVLHKDFSIEGESDSEHYRLTISFNANTISKGVQEQRVNVEVPKTLYKNVGKTIVVRYSTYNPRIVILNGEVVFDDGEPNIAEIRQRSSVHFSIPILGKRFDDNEPSRVESLGDTNFGGQEQFKIPSHPKAGIEAIEKPEFKDDQFYKLYTENHRLYGARIGSVSGTSHDPDKTISFYDCLDLNTDQFLIEDKYNFRYSLEELQTVRIIAKRRRYNFALYQGILEIRFLDGKKRTFLVSSDIEQAKAILQTAGFSLV